MAFKPATGKMTFNGQDSSISLEHVLSFKYLGVPISCSSYSLFKAFNESVLKKTRNYLQSVLSLTKSGPDKSELAHTLWSRVAIPAILYGSEVLPLTQTTINEIERCQSQVGKFILQVPRNTANVSANIDAGLQPIWSLIVEKYLTYATKTMSKPHSYWPKLAMEEQISLGDKSLYTKTLLKYKILTGSFGAPPVQIKRLVKDAASLAVISEQHKVAVTTSAMNRPSRNNWFRRKSWVNDSPFSKIFAEFRACNAGLGNRGPTKDGQFFKLCPLCAKVCAALDLINSFIQMFPSFSFLSIYGNESKTNKNQNAVQLGPSYQLK